MIENKCPSVTIVDPFFGTVKEGTYDVKSYTIPEEFGIYEPTLAETDNSFALIYPNVRTQLGNGYQHDGILINKYGVFHYTVTSRLSSISMEVEKVGRKQNKQIYSTLTSSTANLTVDQSLVPEFLNADQTIITNNKSGTELRTICIGAFVKTAEITHVPFINIYTAIAYDSLHVYRATLSVPDGNNATLTFVQIDQ